MIPSHSGLDEARGILEFRNEVGKIESWIRDKELLVSQGWYFFKFLEIFKMQYL